MQVLAKSSFTSYGRSHHLRIESADDLRNVLVLDEALWVAIGIPIRSLNSDPVFLKLLDRNESGRMLPEELETAIHWLLDTLNVHEGVDARRPTLRLADLNTSTPDGARIYDSATKMIAGLRDPSADEITLAEVRAIKIKVEAQPVSAAGVVLPIASDDAEVVAFIAGIVETLGGVEHPNGEHGVTTAVLETFLSQARAYLEWDKKGLLEQGATVSRIMPLGNDTVAAYKILRTLKDKLEQYFAQCRAVALDPRISVHIQLGDEELEALDFGDPKIIRDLMENAPLAIARADRTLHFDEVLNPEYLAKLGAFRERILEPLLESSEILSEEDWHRIVNSFAEYEAWMRERPPDQVAALENESLRRFLEPRFREALHALIEESRETTFVLDDICLTERLILFQAHLIELANNFVSFPYLYDPERRALFEQGTLVMDGRRFNLAIQVENLQQHRSLAKTSEMFVLYMEIQPTGRRPFQLAVPVTAGGSRNLRKGKRGVFQHVDGSEYDAIVVDLIENPVSLSEAVSAPFRHVAALVTGKIESFTTEATEDLETETQRAVSEVRDSADRGAEPRKTDAKSPPSGASGGLRSASSTAGMVAGGGVAIAALGSSLAYVTKTLAALSVWTILGGIAGAILAVVLPASVLTAIRLRKRDMGAILEGSGWAINGCMRLTRSQSRFFTQTPHHPWGRPLLQTTVKWITVLLAVALLSWAAQRAIQDLRDRPNDSGDTASPAAEKEQNPDEGEAVGSADRVGD